MILRINLYLLSSNLTLESLDLFPELLIFKLGGTVLVLYVLSNVDLDVQRLTSCPQSFDFNVFVLGDVILSIHFSNDVHV